MKKKILAILLLLASSAFAQYANGKFHRGLFFSTSLTFGYTYLRNYELSIQDEGYNEKTHKFNGAMHPYAELRFGRTTANIFSLYGSLGLGFGIGNFDAVDKSYNVYPDNNSQVEATGLDVKFLVGGGAEFYPVQNQENPLYGLFLGFSLGFVIDGVKYTIDENDGDFDGFANIFYRFELGKEWWIDTRWSLGVALNYMYGSLELKDETSSYNSAGINEKASCVTHTIGISVRVAH
jgi:hypothetical protein